MSASVWLCFTATLWQRVDHLYPEAGKAQRRSWPARCHRCTTAGSSLPSPLKSPAVTHAGVNRRRTAPAAGKVMVQGMTAGAPISRTHCRFPTKERPGV
jgi:hypothetical protein